MHNVFLIRKMKAVEFDFFIMKTDPYIIFFASVPISKSF